jgi:hypothetical protein
LLFGGLAYCGTTVSFYTHGWGLGPGGMMYFPHAFVVIERSTSADAPPTEESYGFTAASTTDPSVLMRPSQGTVERPNPVYRKAAVLHFTVEISDAQYDALKQTLTAWGGPGAPLYDLGSHNCVGFVGAIAEAVGLKTPAGNPGEDPVKFVEGVRKLNPDRLVALTTAEAAAQNAPDGVATPAPR